MTPTQKRLVEAMRVAVANGGWRHVPNAYGYTIAWDSEEKNPTYPELVGWTRPYQSHVFITLIRKPILGVARAPWLRRQDTDITYRKAFEVLENPQGCLS